MSNDPPSSRRVTMRMPAVTGVPAPAAPVSRPGAAESETFGRIHRVVQWFDATRGAFSLSRVIMQTGSDLRAYGPGSKDDARVVAKLWSVLDAMLTPDERDSLLRAMREG